MTITFNQEKYQKLLFNYQPKIIRTEAENERFLKMIEHLMSKNDLTPEENELYELLITLVEKFEQEYYQPNLSTKPESMLLFLLEQRDLKPRDLIPIIGSEKMVNDLINGDIVMTKEQALILGDFFNVDYTVFGE
jgi:HTH-type transcriptional regulator / antitoxin HigA